MRWSLGIAILIAAGALLQVPVRGQEGAEADNVLHQRLVEHYKQVAAHYEFRQDRDGNRKFQFVPEPILVYSNRASGRDSHGAFFVWTLDGRAEAIGAIWSYFIDADRHRRSINHEFQSFSLRPFSARSPDGLVWTPRVPGIELKPIPDAPAPVKSKGLRLSQMRRFASRFTGYHTHPVERQLRVLPRPLYRFTNVNPKGEVLDGAIFCLFMDWDPEIMLSIEARRADSGPKWYFGVGRFSDKPLRLEYKGVDVWSHKGGDFGNPNGPFYCAHRLTLYDDREE